MTAARKVVLIVATALVVGGSALALGAFATAGFSFENLSNTTRDWVSHTTTLKPEAESSHTEVVVRDEGEGVRFEPADGDSFEIVYWTGSEKDVEVVDESSVLRITGKGTPFASVVFMKVDFQDRSTVVKVPHGYTGSITVETSSGNIDVADLEGLGDVTLQAASGGVFVQRLGAQSVSLRTLSGSIGADLVDAAGLSANASSGAVSLTDVRAPYVGTSTTSGGQDLRGIFADVLNACATSGGISAEELDVAETSIEATSGGVSAAFVGAETDYAIEASSSSGPAYVPRGASEAARRITVRTSSGGISLDFESEARNLGTRRGGEGNAAPAAPEAPAAPAAPAAR